MHTLRNVFILAVLFAGFFRAYSAPAIERPDVLSIRGASVGFGGKFKAGFWQPVRVTIVAGSRGAKGRLELVGGDGDQTPVIYRDAARGEVNLASGEEAKVLLYCKSGPVASRFTLRLVAGDGEEKVGQEKWSRELALQPRALDSTQELAVGLGADIGLEQAAGTFRRRGISVVQTARVTDPSALPDRWWAYEGVDTLVLPTRDEKFIAEMTDPQRQAIVEWVLLGGRIIVCVGERGAEIAASSSPWAAILPGKLDIVDVLRERSGLENFTKAELPFDDEQFQRNRPRVTHLKDIHGEALLGELSSAAGRPLVIHATAGLGQVTYVGLDLDHPSLEKWKGRTKLVASLLAHPPKSEHIEREQQGGLRQLGYDDLVGQLRAALDQFPRVTLVNFTTVSVLTLIYLLLIGPGDYFLLSRLKLPRQATWLTFSSVALAMIGVALGFDRQSHGNRAKLNQVEIVDIDLTQQVVRGTAWFHLYSPQTRDHDVRMAFGMEQAVGSPQGWLAWQGLPGDALGGLESAQPTLLRSEPYTVSVPGVPGMEGLTVKVASSKSLSSGWWSKSNFMPNSDLSIDRFGLLSGEFVSPLNVPLTECVLAQGEKMYRVGPLAAGQRVQMSDLQPLDLEARLTQRRIEQTKDVSTPWERDSTDVPRIVQMLMFHEAARGMIYTGLTHRYQSKIDLSQHVRLGEAVLVGRAAMPAARLVTDKSSDEAIVDADDANVWTWYRVILPVKKG